MQPESTSNIYYLFIVYCRLELGNLEEIKELMNTEAYEKYLQSVSEDH